MVLEWMSQYKHRTSRHLSVETNVITHDNGAILFNDLLSEAKSLALKAREGKTVIFTSWGPEWRPFGQPRSKRLLGQLF